MFPVKRTQVSLRCATLTDAPFLGESGRRDCGGPIDEQNADLEAIIDRVTPPEEERIVVAEYDGAVAGAVYLRGSTLTPINLEPAVQAISPHVLPEYRRHGVRPGADGGGGGLRRGARDRPGGDGRGLRIPRRQPVHGPARARTAGHAAGGPGGHECRRSSTHRRPAAALAQLAAPAPAS